MSETWQDVLDEPDKKYANEIPLAGRDWMLDGKDVHQPEPETDLQALMEAPPHTEPRTSAEHQREVNQLVEDLVDELEPYERAIIEYTVYAGHSIRMCGRMLGIPKSTVHRMKQAALEKIRLGIEAERYLTEGI